MAKGSKSRDPERRARKAEKRAQNIRDYYGPDDEAAERRAQKAERKAANIRDYYGTDSGNSYSDVGEGDTEVSNESTDSDSGCATVVGVVIVVAVIVWILMKIWDGMQFVWSWWQDHSPYTWIVLFFVVAFLFRKAAKTPPEG